MRQVLVALLVIGALIGMTPRAEAAQVSSVIESLMALQNAVKTGIVSINVAQQDLEVIRGEISQNINTDEVASLNAAADSFRRDLEELALRKICRGPQDLECLAAIRARQS